MKNEDPPPTRGAGSRWAGVPFWSASDTRGPVPGTVGIESEPEIDTSAAVPGTDMEQRTKNEEPRSATHPESSSGRVGASFFVLPSSIVMQPRRPHHNDFSGGWVFVVRSMIFGREREREMQRRVDKTPCWVQY